VTVESEEDNGFVLSLGYQGLTSFLTFDDITENGEDFMCGSRHIITSNGIAQTKKSILVKHSMPFLKNLSKRVLKCAKSR
jgi:hypothetical protein